MKTLQLITDEAGARSLEQRMEGLDGGRDHVVGLNESTDLDQLLEHIFEADTIYCW